LAYFGDFAVGAGTHPHEPVGRLFFGGGSHDGKKWAEIDV
jgi:hypothetical protein